MVDETFNEWRKGYTEGTLTFAEHVEYNQGWGLKYPAQKSFSPLLVRLIRGDLDCNGARKVVEVGGWRGELAAELINHHHVSLWYNHDFPMFPPCEHVPISSPKYYYYPMSDWVWNEPAHVRGVGAGACIGVLSHVLEHLSPKDTWLLVDWLHGCRAIFTETPVKEGGWGDNYEGSHINPMSRREYHKIFAAVGFTPENENGDVVVYKR